MTGYGIPWPADELHVLRAMWADGSSGGVIGTRLGRSRCAVLGKARRLNLSNRPQTAPRHAGNKPRDGKPRAKAARKPASTHPVTRWGNPASYTPTPPRPIVEPPAPKDCKRIGIMQLTACTCRWPLGDPLQPGFAYCGNACDRAVPYCIPHMRQGWARASSPDAEAA